MILFMSLALTSAIAARVWFQWFDDGQITRGDYIVLGIEVGAYLAMFGSIFFIKWGC